jgi:hypothetical protein
VLAVRREVRRKGSVVQLPQGLDDQKGIDIRLSERQRGREAERQSGAPRSTNTEGSSYAALACIFLDDLGSGSSSSMANMPRCPGQPIGQATERLLISQGGEHQPWDSPAVLSPPRPQPPIDNTTEAGMGDHLVAEVKARPPIVKRFYENHVPIGTTHEEQTDHVRKVATV